ncbi:Uncharacterised protein [Pasteurella multocida]|nr:Uncharacterised protein [Pasteurella multocida]
MRYLDLVIEILALINNILELILILGSRGNFKGKNVVIFPFSQLHAYSKKVRGLV